ncbi:MAG: SDR family NAD(P)-dependent oxidoreductase [Parvularculaceae bacterium]|nr:SDR family NAD(P)-dependent oxidoreductase [Parvularculaceae bacterium]
MTKTILLTGATDGIGLETAKRLAADGHELLLHGRSEDKLVAAKATVLKEAPSAVVKTLRADLSNLADVEALAKAVAAETTSLDVLINNAGVFKTPTPVTPEGFDVRFIVNLIAPYVLTRRLLPVMSGEGRIINLSSAAQAPVDLNALLGKRTLNDSDAYAQSKLAITMWSFDLAQGLGTDGPSVVAINPASFLGSKMVKEAYGSAGHDLGIGAEILQRAALSDDFAGITGRYFDNDRRQFGTPHPDALDNTKNKKLVQVIDEVITMLTASA